MSPPIILISLMLFPAVDAGADTNTPRPTALLANFDDLQSRLNDPNLRLLDTRPRSKYDQGHIPGAIWADEGAARELAARPGGLTDREAWEAWLAPLGIGPDTEVLVYDANRQLDAARVWWLLGYLGVGRVGLIDGGFPLWEKQDRPVSKDVPRVEPRAFPVAFRVNRHATRAEVLDAIQHRGSQVIDARSDAEYKGEDVQSKRGGHIPEACHFEWSRLVDADGRFLDPVALKADLDARGVRPGMPVITHCQGGGRSSIDAFVLERLGFPVHNYYLGWSDWGNAEDTPIDR